MTIYDILFDMTAVPKGNIDEKPSRTAARFIDYISRSIEWNASKYIREYNRIHDNEKAYATEDEGIFEKPSNDAEEMIERVENMVAIMNEVAQFKKAEQKVYICLYQLDWNVSKTARVMGCSESYVCRLNRTIIRKLGFALKDSERYAGN